MSDSDYTLLGQSLSLGGVVSRSTDLETGEICENLTTEDGKRSDARRRQVLRDAPLSKVHKGTFIEWSTGASLLKVSCGIVSEAPKGGKRGKIKGFSFASRRRMMYTLARVRRDAELPCFVTLTYPNIFPSPLESKKHLDIFIRRLKRAYPHCGFIWKLEPQKRGAPHYHLLVWGCDEVSLTDFVPVAWHDVAGDGDNLHLMFHRGELGNKHCVSKVQNHQHMMKYASKYLGKTFEVAGWGEVYPGRFWAVVQKENIPFGVVCQFEISSAKAFHIMRYQKRFAGISSRKYPSLTTFCDASQWVKNCIGEVIAEK